MSNIFEFFRKPDARADMPRPITHIVVGLGNPGRDYRLTRHNAGFMALDYISQKDSFEINRSRFGALCGESDIGGKRVLVMKPQLLMNRSGEAVRDAAEFYKILPENITVIFDDISLEPGRMRIRRKGSDGGHKGIRSIITLLGSDAFPRIKLGVGSPPPQYDTAAWVLSVIPESDREKLFDCLIKSHEALALILSGELDAAMNKYN